MAPSLLVSPLGPGSTYFLLAMNSELQGFGIYIFAQFSA